VHGRNGGSAPVWRIQYERNGFKGRRPGLSLPVYAGEERSGKAVKGETLGTCGAANARGRLARTLSAQIDEWHRVMTKSLHDAILLPGGEILMPTMQPIKSGRDTLNLRIKPELRGLIDRAAAATGKNRTDFVLSAARHAAEDALLDRTIFSVSPKAYAEFLARLDMPPQPNSRLRRALETPAPWEK